MIFKCKFNKNEKLIILNKDTDCSSVTGNGYVQFRGKYRDKVTFYCENQWLVIQKRQHAFDTNFNRTWLEYAQGFGSLRSDFWLGLEIVSKLTQHQQYEILIELTDWSEQTFVAQYENFMIGTEEDFFRLSLSGEYKGNASKNYLEDVYYGKKLVRYKCFRFI